MSRICLFLAGLACLAAVVCGREENWQMEGLDFVDKNADISQMEYPEISDSDDDSINKHPRPHPRRPCCLPEAFEATEAAVTGFSGKNKTGLAGAFMPRLAVDFKRGKFAAVEFIFTKGKKFNFTLIGDVKAGKMFLIHFREKSCKAIKIANMTHRCLPKSAKFMGFQRFGVGRHSLVAENYYVAAKTKKASVAVQMTMQAGSCVPIHEEVLTHVVKKNVHAMTSITYSGISLRIRNPKKIFNVPAFCKKAEVVEDPVMSAFLQAMKDRYTM